MYKKRSLFVVDVIMHFPAASDQYYQEHLKITLTVFPISSLFPPSSNQTSGTEKLYEKCSKVFLRALIEGATVLKIMVVC